ncbi:MAG: nitroreductase family protein [Candidatus Lokiarchaeota archaeon]|nr:nitroreductase family protein [Candidatus Lokiarchaeota archaeon]
MIEKIISRRSIRNFQDEKIEKDIILKILEAGRWAPSGLNNQPWEFIVVKSENKDRLAKCTKYSEIIRSAPVCIAVYYNKRRGYSYVKDIQGVAAAMQNMLLAIHLLGLGGVWLGEILNQKDEVNEILENPDSTEFMGVIAFGEIPENIKLTNRSRYPLSKIVHEEKFGNNYVEDSE